MGFLVSLGTIIAPYIAANIALVAFLHLDTALVFLAGLVLVSLLAIRFHEKHHRSERFDDRLSDVRIREAQEWLIRKGGERKNENSTG